jgi:hypothetical protein
MDFLKEVGWESNGFLAVTPGVDTGMILYPDSRSHKKK